MKKVFTIIVFILLVVFCAGLCLQVFATNDKLKPSEWFKHEEVEQPVEDEQDADPDDKGEMVMDENFVGNGIMVMSMPIPVEQYDAYDIMPIAESAQQLTATITPNDATNKIVDWSVAWKNENSSWAKGKTVTSYVTVTPTSDGALTANVQCLQAFGEQVIVTVAVRDAEGINATCPVDYKQKITGVSLKISDLNTSMSNKTWLNLTPANLNPTVDWFFQYSDEYGEYPWSFVFNDTKMTKIEMSLVKSSTYTIADNTGLSGYFVEVSLTSSYLNSIKGGGATPSVDTADKYTVLYANTSGGGTTPTLSSLFGIKSMYASGGTFFGNYSKIRGAVRNVASNVMLRYKARIAFDDGTPEVSTIYNIKFTASSLVSIAQGVTLNSSGLVF